ncbi:MULTISPECIES: DUF488 domain-containing protein [Methylosinus]|uniref:DUF488 domain-containing protein n=1 Tax=Methylosinus trichosporium (strain ATCC 35070 / NCIMB 11131 / UNIQEM 75 / OB3b) TaxID=595536 RepID=A0A2D2D562_METT3|nr:MULTISPECIES: DUF488 family protein [Methylosinus]ATQ70167.1 DUF488 domain-containing protein [Methylosinus trichosporium OB3b]OBS51435.1 hypothetical protein A8B73_16370 [Methylosinus sp. 3S-1]
MLEIKRVYDPPAPDDGMRILVDRLWPRGLSKARAALDEWNKEIAPSDALRRWFGHRPERWEEFKARYAQEIRERHAEDAARLRRLARGRVVTLLFAAREPHMNNAAALKEIIARRAGPQSVAKPSSFI